MRNLFLLMLLFSSVRTTAQSFYFPPAYHKDSIALAQHLPALALQVINSYKEADRATYLDQLFRLQLVARQYDQSVTTLDSLRDGYKQSDSLSVKGVGFQFEVYAKACQAQAVRHVSFEEAYQRSFAALYNALPQNAVAVATGYFDTALPPLKDRLQALLAKQATKDSLTLEEAKTLCRAFNAYNVYGKSLPLATPLLATLDNARFIIEDSVLIKTPDGALIAATVVRSKDVTTKLPAIFIFNIYTGGIDKARAREAAANGYVGVVANTRGKRLSPQEIEPFEHDATDAYAIIDWISKQPWSDGRVGMYGGSYLGFSQWAALKKVHPALKTIVPQVAVGIGVDYPMSNNVFMSYMLRWIHYVTNSKKTDEADFRNEDHWDSVFRRWYSSGPAFRSLDSLEGRPSKIFQRWLQHPAQDAFWQNMVPYKQDFAQINIPILTTTGYYDDDQLGALYYYREHHRYHKNPQHYLLIGPYDHGGAQSVASAVLNGYTIDSVANISITNLTYQWFNYILKDSARPALLKDKVNYEVMGANEWKHAPSLAKMNNDTLTFYLSAVRTGQYYKLETKPPAATEYIHQEVDFCDRSDSLHSASYNILDSAIDLHNKLSFITPVFNKPVIINGSFLGGLYASINKKDMDISLQMYEVLANGKYLSLGGYTGRASYAKDRSRRQLLVPGQKEMIPVKDSYFTSRQVQKGSRLLITLGVNKGPDWQINYGTGKDVSTETIQDAGEPLQVKWFNNSYIKIAAYR